MAGSLLSLLPAGCCRSMSNTMECDGVVIDIIEFPTSSKGNKYAVVMMDYCIVRIFLRHYIFVNFVRKFM